MSTRRFRLPLILQVRVVLAVMLLQPPRDWGGGYGHDRDAVWIYECTTCDYVKPLPEQVFGRDVPFCKHREHGRLELVERV
jgi:hypothetical protein